MPCISVIEQKKALRQAVRKRAASLSPREREAQEKALFKAFLALDPIRRARTILLFWGVGSEMNTVGLISALLASGKQVALPRCLPGGELEARRYRGGRLLRGPANIPEPGEDCRRLEKEELDAVLVPALCYDRERYRLGQGGGYYDRFLADYEGLTVGLCFRELLQERVPREPHDLPVKILLKIDEAPETAEEPPSPGAAEGESAK